MGNDRSRRTEGIRSNTEYDGVAAAEHSGGVGEHIGAALEHETDHTQTTTDLVDPPAFMLGGFDHTASARGSVTPGSEPFDHAGAHLVAQDETRRRSSPGASLGHVRSVRSGDRAERIVVGERGGEHLVELGDALVADLTHPFEGVGCCVDGVGCDGLFGGGDVQQTSVALHHDQGIPRAEGRCEIFVYP